MSILQARSMSSWSKPSNGVSRYQGLDPKLKEAVFVRDNWRCRWCGSTNRLGYDAHHIEYRRGYSYDRLDNLITLCRICHNYVHDSYSISKATAQQILLELISDAGSGRTGLALWRKGRADLPTSAAPIEIPSAARRFLTGSVTPGRILKDEDHG